MMAPRTGRLCSAAWTVSPQSQAEPRGPPLSIPNAGFSSTEIGDVPLSAGREGSHLNDFLP